MSFRDKKKVHYFKKNGNLKAETIRKHTLCQIKPKSYFTGLLFNTSQGCHTPH